jgi:hypothetical protein
VTAVTIRAIVALKQEKTLRGMTAPGILRLVVTLTPRNFKSSYAQTATMLGLSVPDKLLAAADEVIE